MWHQMKCNNVIDLWLPISGTDLHGAAASNLTTCDTNKQAITDREDTVNKNCPCACHEWYGGVEV